MSNSADSQGKREVEYQYKCETFAMRIEHVKGEYNELCRRHGEDCDRAAIWRARLTELKCKFKEFKSKHATEEAEAERKKVEYAARKAAKDASLKRIAAMKERRESKKKTDEEAAARVAAEEAAARVAAEEAAEK